MPFHGDFKRLRLHAQLAEAVGIDAARTSSRARTACRWSIDERGARFGDARAGGDDLRRRRRHRRHGRRRAARPADALGRRHLHRRGDDRPSRTASSVADPEVIFRGVPFLDEADELRRGDPRRPSRTRSTRAARRGDPRGRPAPAGRCTTTWRRSSTTASSAARWCCRSSSRSERSGEPGRPWRLGRGPSAARQRTTKRAPPSSPALQAHAAAVRLGDRLHDREAEARTTRRDRRRRARSARTALGASSGGMPGPSSCDDELDVAVGARARATTRIVRARRACGASRSRSG